MRLIGSVLSLGVIIWVMVQAAGGGSSNTALLQDSQGSESLVSPAHQNALEKAKTVESTVQDSFQDQFSVLDGTH